MAGGEVAQNEGQQAEGSQFIKLKVIGMEGNEIQFRIKKTTLMGKLMRNYSERMGMSMGSLRFLFDGRRISEESTPTVLELEDDDVIEVFQEQTGGNIF